MSRVKQQIIAMGGGGFSMEPKNMALDAYVLEQARAEVPSVLFIPTASGDSDAYVARFYAAFAGLRCRPRHLPLFRTSGVLRDTVLSHDVLYVGGGNTRTMLAVWREWGLPEAIREALENGSVLAGLSAGAICWFEQGVTDSSPGELTSLRCLGILPGSCCPHYDGEAARRPAYADLLRRGEIAAGYAIDDGAAIHFVNGSISRVVASRPGASAYRVAWDTESEAATEVPLRAEVLQALTPSWPTF
jgi:dipeptidase E